MTNGSLRIDDQQILDALDRFKKPQLKEIVLSALKKGADILREDTQSRLKVKLGPGATSTRHHKKSLVEGVVAKVDEDFLEVRVSVFGDFRLKWFEAGTKERKLKRRSTDHKVPGKKVRLSASRGRIQALGFFEDARNHNEAALIDTIKKQLTQDIQNFIR